MEEYVVEPVERRERKFLILLLVVLLLLFSGLLYLYLILIKPPQSLVKPKLAGLDFQFQMFGRNRNDLMNRPHDVAVDSKGNIYVSDTLNDRILVFSDRGKFRKAIPARAVRPLGIDVAPNGDILVVSKRQDKVVVLSPAGKVKKTYKAFIPLDAKYFKKSIYVTTIGPIVVFDSKGERKLWGTHGRKEGQFAWPNGITVGNDGTIFVSDTNNLRLQVIKPNGKLKWALGKPPTQALYTPAEGRAFGAPAGITVDEDNNIYVVDGFRDRIYVFSPQKKLLASWGGERGDAEGQFDHPAGIAYLGNGVIAVADKFNNRVQVFRVSRPWKKVSVAARIENYWYFILPLILLLLALLFLFLRRRHTQEDAASDNSWG